MAEVNARDAKIIQYLNEAYGKEKQLETGLQAHIQITTRPPYKKRLQQHLKETKDHGKQLERRIKKLGGTAETSEVPGGEAVSGAAAKVQNVANRAAALAQGPLHALRGTSEQEKMLKNAKTEFQDEAEEIANYTAIEALATAVGDKETATLAKKIRREEERMRDFLGKQIPQLTKAVATAEIPASERSASTTRRRSTSSRSGASRSTASRSSGRAASSSSRSKSASRSGGTTKRASGTSRSTRSTGSRGRSTSSNSGSRPRSSSSRSSR
ncbi:MAG: hypothetical protein NVSMB25_17430 [Thermoleophilaceae bacterium]